MGHGLARYPKCITGPADHNVSRACLRILRESLAYPNRDMETGGHASSTCNVTKSLSVSDITHGITSSDDSLTDTLAYQPVKKRGKQGNATQEIVHCATARKLRVGNCLETVR